MPDAIRRIVELQKRLDPIPHAFRDLNQKLERLNPVPRAMRRAFEIQKSLVPTSHALTALTVEPPKPAGWSTPMRVVKNVEPVWNVTGESGPPFSIDTERTTPHYFIRRVPGTSGGNEVEVNFLGDAEREGVAGEAQLPDGKLVFYYTTSTGHLGQLLRDSRRTGCFLLKKDGSVWKLLGIDFFDGGDAAVARLRRQKRKPDAPLDMASRLLEEDEKDLAAIKAGTELEKHLRALAVRLSISPDHNGVPKKADRLNSELAGAGCYSQLDQKNITAWLDLRNKAAHGHSGAFTAKQVAVMIEGVREFVAKYEV